MIALAEYPCAALHRVSTALITTLVQYHAATDAVARQALWRTAQHQYGAMMDVETSGENCDTASINRFNFAYSIYGVLAMANRSEPINSSSLSLDLDGFAVSVMSFQGEVYLGHSHDLDVAAGIGGFDADFFRWVVAQLVSLYRTNHIYLDVSNNKSNADFLQYWAPGYDSS
jgi:hypothetical protein